MAQVVHHRFANAQVKYLFKNRTKDRDLRPYADEIAEELARYATLRFLPEEIAFLRSIRWFRRDFVDSLVGYQPDFADVTLDMSGEDLSIEVAGTWEQTIWWEVPLLAIVNEVFFRNTTEREQAHEVGRERLKIKIAQLRQAEQEEGLKPPIIEFGTRRRFSAAWQEEVLTTLVSALGDQLIGTSNVGLAHRYNLKPMGTMAHEFLQAMQAFYPLAEFQQMAFENWIQQYRGDLGIALSDVVGMDAFLRDFDLLLCKAFDGARHDSGDPKVWVDKLIAHYEANRIDPRTKMAVFSDGLDIPTMLDLERYVGGRIKTSYGIGTNLSNDCGPKALQIVMKMIECNGQPVAKVSDSPGKTMCQSENFVRYLRELFAMPPV
jgi:nicotinate phosphoribosyltransferase